MNTSILNTGLKMAMEFGENWLMPIQQRLQAEYSELGQGELNEYNKQCRSAMMLGHKELPLCWREAKADEKVAFVLFSDRIHLEYPWVSDDNLASLFSQSCYYAWKNGDLL